MSEHPIHHLIYGHLHDYLTGERLLDTDDERIRQRITKMMVEDKCYKKDTLEPRCYIDTLFNLHFVRSTIELTVTIANKRFMIIRYDPGSLVSRQRSAVAAARVLDDRYRIPLAVVTNGQDAELIDTNDGKIIGSGLAAIPNRQQAEELVVDLLFLPPQHQEKRQRELRILNAFDLERCCL